MTEKELRQSIVETLTSRGWLVLRLEEAVGWGRPGTKGLPDLVAIKAGRHLWIEVKTENKRSRLSMTQTVVHEMLKAAGAEVLVARSVDAVLELV